VLQTELAYLKEQHEVKIPQLKLLATKRKTLAGINLSHYCQMFGGDEFGHLSLPFVHDFVLH